MELALMLILAAVCTPGLCQEQVKYTTRYDDFDIDVIIGNERLLANYVNCLLDRGSCTPDGMELKRNMPDALQTGCSKCSEKQRQSSDKLIRYLMSDKPEYWKPLQEKYDPSGIYTSKYVMEVESESSSSSSSEEN